MKDSEQDEAGFTFTPCAISHYVWSLPIYVPAEWLSVFFFTHLIAYLTSAVRIRTNHWTLWGGSTKLTLATGLGIQTQSREQIQQLQNSTYVMHAIPHLETNWALWGLRLARPSAHKHLGNHMFVNQTKASWNLKSLFLSPQFKFHPHNKHTHFYVYVVYVYVCRYVITTRNIQL